MIKVNFWKDNSQLFSDLSWESYLSDYKLHTGLVWIDMFQANEEEWAEITDQYSLDQFAIQTSKYYTDYPVIEEYDNCVFLATHIYVMNTTTLSSVKKELDMFIGKEFLITAHRGDMPLIDHLRLTIGNAANFIRCDAGMLAAYILHEHISSIVKISDLIEDRVEQLETKILTQKIDRIMDEIMDLRGYCNHLKRNIRPLADQFNNLIVYDNELFTDRAKRSLSVLSEKTVSLIANIDLLRDSINGIQNSYLSVLSNKMSQSSYKMNEVIHRLTVVSTIFLPLTFITGWFGMNFTNMPLIKSSYGYAITFALTVFIAVFLNSLFKRKGWYSGDDNKK